MRVTLAALGLALLISTASALPAFALAPAGSAVVVDATGNALRSGVSDTQFTLQLPKGAACQGDSKDGGYRVQSFMVPARYEPGALSYNSVAPEGEGNWSLFDVFTNPYVQAQTGVAEEKGDAGPIVNTPLFSLAVYLPRLDLLASGSYHVGLACTRYNQTKRFWATDVRISAQPAAAEKITWRVLDPAPAIGGGSAPVVPIGAAVVTVAVVAASVTLGRRRVRTSMRAVEARS
ncbi:MAG: hypothetical protein H0U92_04970 [Actinobacteria bacterium]|nr:hypothetical protein [Actinomycetota bacterium]